MFDKIPGLSKTSKRRQAEKNLLVILVKFSFFLSFSDNEKGNFIFPLKIEDISETNAEVVAEGPAPSP